MMEELRRSLQEAEERLPSERSELEDVRDMLSRRESEVQELDRRQRTLHGEMEGLPSLEKELADARRHYDEVEKQRQEAQLQQRLAESELERLDGVAGELKGQEARREELTTQVGIYGDLAVAFGKNGIQALIIETAAELLEEESTRATV